MATNSVEFEIQIIYCGSQFFFEPCDFKAQQVCCPQHAESTEELEPIKL